VKLRAALGAYIDADLTSAASDGGLETAKSSLRFSARHGY
jgi:hypothetical protein